MIGVVDKNKVGKIRRHGADDQRRKHQFRAPQGQYRRRMGKSERQQFILPEDSANLNSHSAM